jgi:hypothetical protein
MKEVRISLIKKEYEENKKLAGWIIIDDVKHEFSEELNNQVKEALANGTLKTKPIINWVNPNGSLINI